MVLQSSGYRYSRDLIRADELRKCVGDKPVVGAKARRNITVSLGVAVSTDHATGDISSLLNQADRGLYAAKREGRNRAVHVEEPRSGVDRAITAEA